MERKEGESERQKESLREEERTSVKSKKRLKGGKERE